MAQIYEDSLEKVGEEYGPLSLQMEDKLKEVFIIYLHTVCKIEINVFIALWRYHVCNVLSVRRLG
jgi:hypothetical protein